MSVHTMPSADIVFDNLFAYQRSGALKAAVELELFTAIDEGATTAAAIAKRCSASERGVRILCDFLTVHGLLKKSDFTYGLTPEAAAFLSKKSPAYLGTTAAFLLRPELRTNMDDLTASVRRGGVAPAGSTVSEENPIWVEFAKSMAPMMVPAAHGIADVLGAASAGAMKVLDIAAGHGVFGITIAQRNPRVEVVAVDWGPVLAVARENAEKAGVQDRYQTKAGDAFTAEFGEGYDVALVTNFLHHFDPPTCTSLLAKIHRALKPGGRVVVLEFVPNPDRVSPPMPAGFALTMLSGTPSGDAYTLAELKTQLEGAGFGQISAHPLPTPETIVMASK